MSDSYTFRSVLFGSTLISGTFFEFPNFRGALPRHNEVKENEVFVTGSRLNRDGLHSSVSPISLIAADFVVRCCSTIVFNIQDYLDGYRWWKSILQTLAALSPSEKFYLKISPVRCNARAAGVLSLLESNSNPKAASHSFSNLDFKFSVN